MEDSGNSEASTTQQTSTSTTDARVGADNGSVVIQAGGQQNISFSPEIAQFGTSLVSQIADFSGEVLKEARTIVTESMMTQQQAIEGALDFGKSSLDFGAKGLEFGSKGLEFGKSALIAAPSTSASAGNAIASTQNKNVYIIAAVAGVVGLIFLLKRK